MIMDSLFVDAPSGPRVVVLHPDAAIELKQISARARWYDQHRENRLARREGREPRDAASRCSRYPGEVGEILGFRFVEGGR